METLLLLGLTIAGFLLTIDRHNTRVHTLTNNHRADTAAMVKAHRAEVATLLQRIQAPQVAVIEHNQGQQPPASVQHAMTDQEAAEAEERARMIAELERLENEALR